MLDATLYKIYFTGVLQYTVTELNNCTELEVKRSLHCTLKADDMLALCKTTVRLNPAPDSLSVKFHQPSRDNMIFYLPGITLTQRRGLGYERVRIMRRKCAKKKAVSL